MTSPPETPLAASPDDRWEEDPVFLNSRKEAIIIFFVWLAAFLWVVPFSYLQGFQKAEAGTIATLWGVPAWLFWGVFIPWMVAALFTIWFAFAIMKDDPLEPQSENQEAAPSDKQEGV